MKFLPKRNSDTAPKTTEKVKIKNLIARTHGVYATAVVAVVLAAVVLLNVLFVVVGDRMHLSWDLTSQGTFTISDSNIAYLKTIKHSVEITVCASEQDYTGDYFTKYADAYFNTQDSTGKYYSQTVALVKEYGEYNDNITVKFIDPQTSQFNKIAQSYPDLQIAYGDILVSSSFKGEDGTNVSRHKLVTFLDIYEQTDESGMAAYGYTPYDIGSNNIETMLTGAIAKVTSEEDTVITVISSHCQAAFLEDFIKELELNGYEISYVSDPIINEESISEETDMLLLGGVMSDFTVEELDVINTFLENGEDRGKGLLFFASTASPKLPNLYAFLEEWGISVGNGVLYETTEDYTYQAPTNMLILNNKSEYTTDVNNMNGFYLAGNLVPMDTAFERYDGRKTNILLYTSDSVIVAPVGIDDTFKPDDSYAKGLYSAAILTVDTSYENDANGLKSYVGAFASTDFVASNWAEYNDILDLEMALSVADVASGKADNGITFTSKSIAPESFSDKVTTQNARTIEVVFLFVIPISLLVVCVVVYIRRKNR